MNKICILFGGRSSEHKDSVDSFQNLFERIVEQRDGLGYELASVIYIDTQNVVHLSEGNYSWRVEDYLIKGTVVDLFEALNFVKRNDHFLFSTLFSQNGEDGRMQGLCRMLEIESNLGDPLQPSICLSKYHLNQYVQGTVENVLIPETLRVSSLTEVQDVFNRFEGSEVVIKPNALGSSILTDKLVLTKENLALVCDMIEKILVHDTYALVQAYISGVEYTCGVMENNGEVETLPLGKVTTARNFFGFPEKNDAALNSKSIVNAEDSIVLQKLERASRNLFLDLDLKNIARFDYIVRGDEIYFLECNQFPSLHRYSFFMMMLKHRGMTIPEVVEIVIRNEKTRKVKEPLFDGYAK